MNVGHRSSDCSIPINSGLKHKIATIIGGGGTMEALQKSMVLFLMVRVLLYLQAPLVMKWKTMAVCHPGRQA